MPGEIFDFEWFIHNEGYACVTGGSADGPAADSAPIDGNQGRREQLWITIAGPPSSNNLLARRRYFPLREYSCLFRIFAETTADSDGIIGFANRFGLLGLGMDGAPGRSRPFAGTAEPRSAWLGEMGAMKSAVGLWDMVSAGRSEDIEAYLRPVIHHADILATDRGSISSGISQTDVKFNPGELRWYRTNPEIIALFAAGEYQAIALRRVQAIVNERLGSRVSPRILWEDPRKREWGMYFVPHSLIGAIWTQFAQAITENRDYRRCRQCDTWFEIDHYKARTNRYFCSNACRSKAYRERQQEARRMASAGVSLESIAAKLGSDIETVGKWVG